MTSIIGSVAVFAHEGGWDEVLLVGIPIVLIIGLLAIAKRRLGGLVTADPPDDAHQPPTPG